MRLAGRRVVLGVSGGIACYKACAVARSLTEMGAAVDVVLTAAAAEFVGPVTFEALTHRPVRTSLWARGAALDHVHLARDPDLIVVAPATANLLARAAHGVADDFLTALLLARTIPILAAPAMNDGMYAHPATTANIAELTRRDWEFVGPDVGALAEGNAERPGRMSEPDEIVARAERVIRGRESPLRGRRVLVTAGPTREGLDPVRVITNRSSGRMGYELAAAAFSRGADVTLVTGPTALAPPVGVDVVGVETTDELREAVAEHLPASDVVLMAAAPADFKTEAPASEKRPRGEGPLGLDLIPTPDVLETTRELRKAGAVIVGFALETGDGPARARAKLERKGLDFIVLNMANEPGAGFEVETNRVTIVDAEGETALPRLTKRETGEEILDVVERRV